MREVDLSWLQINNARENKEGVILLKVFDFITTASK